jgi:serine/threonine protein kinase
MALQAGSRLGPYEVLSLIGAGGTGEVYQARDTRLDRKVAVKVLAPELASDAEFRARFTHEAKAISALDHPHICGLYDIGREHDTEYLVLELLEGETLAARLERGSLPLAQVLRFGIEIADALEAAHRQGIVHRDLKPGNIMLTVAGTKLLDSASRSTRLVRRGKRSRCSQPHPEPARHKARSSAHCNTWRPSRYRADSQTHALTSSRWARSSRR